MNTAVIGVGLLAIAFILHLAWWRIAVPRRQTAVLLGLFFGVLAVWLVVSRRMPDRWFTATGIWQAFHVVTFHTACTLAYVVAYSAIEHRSPSMTLLLTVADCGGAGCTASDLQGRLISVSPVEVRLDAMVHDRMIVREGDDYHLATKGQLWVCVLSTWRRCLGLPRGG